MAMALSAAVYAVAAMTLLRIGSFEHDGRVWNKAELISWVDRLEPMPADVEGACWFIHFKARLSIPEKDLV